MVKNIEKVKYLIIGNSAGGIGAAEAIREIDKRGNMAIISDELYPAYSRPLIAEYLVDKCPLEKILFRPPDFYGKNRITTLFGRRVLKLHTDAHTVALDDEKIIAWEKLLLATGASPVLPQIKGAGKRGIFTFTTLDAVKEIDQFLSQLRNRTAEAVVIGGGIIGVGAAEALAKKGVKITLIVRSRIMRAILDEEASALEEITIKQGGINIITGHTVAEINSRSGDTITSITLDDGRTIPCALVIVATGIWPRTELTTDTGMKVNHGIVVDRRMMTSSPGIYACGDVAEAYDFIYDDNRLTPIWPNAYLGGRVAGFNMAGLQTQYQGGTAMNSIKYFSLNMVTAGMANPPNDDYEVISQKHGNSYRKIVLKDGLVVGMIFTDNIEKSGIIFNLMKNKVNVDSFKQVLLANDFSLVALPEQIWRPHLKATPSKLGSQTPVG